MLTSSRLNRTTQVDVVKTVSGRSRTKGSSWLNSVVSEFIVSTNHRRAVDPFAGNDMLDLVGSKFSMQKSGYDIDDSTVWEVNDSLVSIPRSPGSICITNPPFLAKYSARRKSMWPMVGRYYERYGRNDLYEIALDRCLASFGHVVAILPETFLHSAYSGGCERIIVEENPFNDTTFPVCVVGSPQPQIKTRTSMSGKTKSLGIQTSLDSEGALAGATGSCSTIQRGTSGSGRWTVPRREIGLPSSQGMGLAIHVSDQVLFEAHDIHHGGRT